MSRKHETDQSKLLDSVDQKTDMVGKNRFEVLLFNMGSEQRFGINVFKVKEVINSIELSEMPGAHKSILGVANIRGESIPVVDLRLATGLGRGDTENGLYIVTEYNGQSQAFLVSTVDRIVNIKWSDVSEPPATLGGTAYITSITKLDDQIIGIVDVERVLTEISPPKKEEVEPEYIQAVQSKGLQGKQVMVVDDSAVARKQVEKALKQLKLEPKSFVNGLEALTHLKSITESGRRVSDVYDLIISDIEMPEMDGYTLTSEIRKDDEMKDMNVVLHTSMSGIFNETLVNRAGADRFMAKFNPDQLSQMVIEMLTQ